MIILGIDPGTSIVGYAVIKKTAERNAALIEADSIQPKSKDAGRRLLEIHHALNRIADIHRPALIGLEKVFFSKNMKTALRVAEARGAILLTAELKNIRVCEYTPLEVKMAATGYGRADKRQIKEMMKVLFKTPVMPVLDDITDAMAIAFTALQEKETERGIQAKKDS